MEGRKWICCSKLCNNLYVSLEILCKNYMCTSKLVSQMQSKTPATSGVQSNISPVKNLILLKICKHSFKISWSKKRNSSRDKMEWAVQTATTILITIIIIVVKNVTEKHQKHLCFKNIFQVLKKLSKSHMMNTQKTCSTESLVAPQISDSCDPFLLVCVLNFSKQLEVWEQN